MKGDPPCGNCHRATYRKGDTIRHRSYHTRDSVFCDETPFTFRKATSAKKDDCENESCIDGKVGCWMPGGPCDNPDAGCECCGPCAHCVPELYQRHLERVIARD